MNMRSILDLIKPLLEGEVIDLAKHKTDKAMGDFVAALDGVYKGERDFFSTGKFRPMAKAYVDSGFKKEFLPEIGISVHFHDYRPAGEAKEFLKALRTDRFKILKPIPLAKGYKQAEGDMHPLGPFADKSITLMAAREIFANRDHSPYGAYQASRSGFRTACNYVYDERGIGFNLCVSGYDPRRPDKYGNSNRHETHIIDNDEDMREVVEMFAAIQRAQIVSRNQ